jgi:hypothetical protein
MCARSSDCSRWHPNSFPPLSLPRDSIHFGAGLKAHLLASQEIAEIIAGAVRCAAVAHNEVTLLETARAATDLAAELLPITKDADGLPHAGGVEAFQGYRAYAKSWAQSRGITREGYRS